LILPASTPSTAAPSSSAPARTDPSPAEVALTCDCLLR
jgi:hypothetical protein